MRKHRVVKFVAALIFLAALLYGLVGLVTTAWVLGRGLGAGWGSGWRGWLVVPILVSTLFGAASLAVFAAVLYFLARMEDNLALAARNRATKAPVMRAPVQPSVAEPPLIPEVPVLVPIAAAGSGVAAEPETAEVAEVQPSTPPVETAEVVIGAEKVRFPTVEIYETTEAPVTPPAAVPPDELVALRSQVATLQARIAELETTAPGSAELPVELPEMGPAQAGAGAQVETGGKLPGSEEAARIAAEMAAHRPPARHERPAEAAPHE
jgi:hypothetical protein